MTEQSVAQAHAVAPTVLTHLAPNLASYENTYFIQRNLNITYAVYPEFHYAKGVAF